MYLLQLARSTSPAMSPFSGRLLVNGIIPVVLVQPIFWLSTFLYVATAVVRRWCGESCNMDGNDFPAVSAATDGINLDALYD